MALFILLILIECLIILLNGYVFRHDLMSPASISAVVFLVATILAFYCQVIWKINLSGLTVMVIALGLLTMTVGESIGRHVKVVYHPREYVEDIELVTANPKTIAFLTVVVVAATLLYGVNAYRVGLMNGGSGLNAYTFDDFEKSILPGQTTTKMIRNYHKFEGIIKGGDIDVGSYPGDQKEAFLLCMNGKVKCIQEKWSAYRLVTSHGSSHMATLHYDREEELYYWKQLSEYTLKYFPENKHAIQYLLERVIYCYFIGRCQKYQYKRKYDILRYYKLIPDKVGLYVYMCRIILWPFRSIPRLVKKLSWKYKSQ